MPNGSWKRAFSRRFDNIADARILAPNELDRAQDDVLAYYVEYADRNFSEAFRRLENSTQHACHPLCWTTHPVIG